MDAHAAVACSQDGAKVTCTASTPGVPFTSSASVISGPVFIDTDNDGVFD